MNRSLVVLFSILFWAGQLCANPPIPGLNLQTIQYLGTPGGLDTTAPTLFSPTGTATGETTADGTVSTNESGGTLFAVASTSATDPTEDQVEAGQDHTGGAAAASASLAVSSTGVQNVSFTGLTSGTNYYVHYMHKDASANQSAVVSSAAFTTTSAWTGSPRAGSPQLTNSATTDSTSFTVTLATHAAGDTLVMWIVADQSPTMTCTGWTQIGTRANSVNAAGYLFRRNTVAASSSETDPTCTASTSQQYSAEAWSIPGAALLNVVMSAGVTNGSGNTVDPDALTPGGTHDFLWLALAGSDNNSLYSITGFPSGYTGTSSGGNGNSGGVLVGVAHKATTATTTENPGVFTFNASNEQMLAATAAVYP